MSVAFDKVNSRNGKLIKDAAASTADSDSAAVTRLVDVAKDADGGLTLKSAVKGSLHIGLPYASSSAHGYKGRTGVVGFKGSNGSSNAVIPTDNGVQLLTTIESKKAPNAYPYPISVPKGGKIKLAPNGAGAAVLDKKGEVIAGVDAPWAKDAKGKDVRTYFSVEGNTLIQHVAHKQKGVTYPVVADPIIVWLPLVTLYCFIAGSYEARNLRGQPWYIWAWGLFLACVPF